jgi:hypothetical protein
MVMATKHLWLAIASVVLTALGSFGCAPTAQLPPGVSAEPMPQGGEWQGVYQGPYHIYLRITRVGDHAQGTWRAMGGREGALWGDVDGNVMRFTWSEHDTQNNGTWSGRGYFVYLAKNDGTAPEIRGKWGLGMSDSSGSWVAVKRPEVTLEAAEKKLADTDSTGPGEDNAQGSVCMGAACVGDDRELNDTGGDSD